jgi:hypothetical protein
MKISPKDLKDLYRDYLEDEPTISRTKCPSSRDITACIRGERSKNRRHQIIDHIFQCSCCHEEFELILKIIREENRFIHTLDIWFPIHHRSCFDLTFCKQHLEGTQVPQC